MMKRKWMWIGLLIGGLVCACTATQPRWHCEETLNGARTQKYEICSDKKEYEYGETVRVRFTVTNLSAQPLHLSGGSSPVMEILDISELSWSATQSQMDTQLTLAPESSHTIEWLWIPTQAHLEDLFSKSQSRPFMTPFTGQVAGESVVSVDVVIKSLTYDPVASSDALPGYCEGGRRPVGDLELQLCMDKREYQYGEPVHIRWQIRNISDSPITLDGGDVAAADVYLVEWMPSSIEGEEHYGEERWSNTHVYENQVELAPGEIYLIEWQWPTPQTNLTAILEHQRIPDKNKALVNVYGDYSLQPGNRWVFSVKMGYLLENDK
ncbi:MAG: hypothetical protein WHX52_22040 [Anaerolineae bacterium]